MKRVGNTNALYFACAPGYLDIYTLYYRWFGIVWTRDDRLRQFVRGFWFGDGKEEVLEQVRYDGWNSIVEVNDNGTVTSIYEAFRRKQSETDWNRRSCLPIRSLLAKRWRTAKSGWYVLRSRDVYPLYLSAVRKRGWFVYVVHAAVCENEAHKLHFIDKVQAEHRIELQRR